MEQVERLKTLLDMAYMSFVCAHTTDKYEAENSYPQSESDDETFAFHPPAFEICGSISELPFQTVETPRSVYSAPPREDRPLSSEEESDGDEVALVSDEYPVILKYWTRDGMASPSPMPQGASSSSASAEIPPMAPRPSRPPPPLSEHAAGAIIPPIVGGTDPIVKSEDADPLYAVAFTSIALVQDIARTGFTVHPRSAGIHYSRNNGYFCLWFTAMSWDVYTATKVDGHITLMYLRKEK